MRRKTETYPHIQGLIAAPPTPMLPDGSVHFDAVDDQCAYLSRNGVCGVFVCGTTGEGMSLTFEERVNTVERWVKSAPEAFKVIVHVGFTDVEESRKLAKHARDSGAWGMGAAPPPRLKSGSLSDLVAFCGEVASSAPRLPFYYYHIPSITGVLFPMKDFLEKAAHTIPNLAGIKYTWKDLMDYSLCRKMGGGRFDMLLGRDELLICGLALGARGAVGSTYNLAAPLYLQLIEAFDEGNLERARALQEKSMEMIHAMRISGGSFQAALKSVSRRVGPDLGPVRAPLENLTLEQEERLVENLCKIGFFDRGFHNE